jgi:dipeptidyl aminopeptidase/acylaminoacyl peptidase
MVPGLESAKEEMEAYELPFLSRGIATLMIDGPGQGEAEYKHRIRGDSEVPIAAVVDWVLTRTDVDARRIGLWGTSMGGYLAARAAAFEKRIRACIDLAGPYDFHDIWDNLPELSREAFRVRSHCSTQDEAKAYSATLTLKGGIARQIDCPLFIVMGKQDRLVDWRHAQRLADEVSGPVDLLFIEDGNHIANNRTWRWRGLTADWMAQKLDLPRQ